MADSTVPPRPRISAPLRGVLWMVASCACFALMATMVRRASFDVHPVEIVFFRYLFGLLFLAPWLLRAGLAPLRTRRLGMHLFRALAGMGVVLTWFTAVSLMPLAEATALAFTAPLFATLGAALFLGESVRLRRWSAIAIGFAGAAGPRQFGLPGHRGAGHQVAVAHRGIEHNRPLSVPSDNAADGHRGLFRVDDAVAGVPGLDGRYRGRGNHRPTGLHPRFCRHRDVDRHAAYVLQADFRGTIGLFLFRRGGGLVDLDRGGGDLRVRRLHGAPRSPTGNEHPLGSELINL